MTGILWTIDDAVAAMAAETDGIETTAISGISIDTRSLQPGDLFVALEATRDGHEFVPAAFRAGAAAALVARPYARQPGDGLLLQVDDPLEALVALGRAARERLEPGARVIAVTGSAGKTTTKEMLRTALSAIGPTHASEKSYNNHWGVPLTLARMPAGTRFGVFEIGMNHAGEITPLSRMVRPDVAIVTTVEAVHLEHFATVADIARAKAEIFEGLDSGFAVIPSDNPHYPILREAASRRRTVSIVSFMMGHAGAGAISDSVSALPAGLDYVPPAPTVALLTTHEHLEGTRIIASLPGGIVRELSIGLPGRHNVSNALAVMAALEALGRTTLSLAEIDEALAALSTMSPPPGRGDRFRLSLPSGTALLVDESYNANPASMAAAIATIAAIPRSLCPRRIVVLGDMLELGPEGPALHAGLAGPIAEHGVDLVLAAGAGMAHLYERLPDDKRGGYAADASGLAAPLLAAVRGGDVVMIKGSNGSRMAQLVAALKAAHAGVTAADAPP